MLDIEVIGIEALGPDAPNTVEIEELCALALSSASKLMVEAEPCPLARDAEVGAGEAA